MSELRIIPIPVRGEVEVGDDVAEIIGKSLRETGESWRDGDILAVAHKIVSKAEGRVVALESVKPSAVAKAWAARFGKDPRIVELALSQARRIIRMENGVIIGETIHGFVCANCGIDASNAPPGHAILLPKSPDQAARKLRSALMAESGIELACLVTDSFGRPWRMGLVNVALGVAGMEALTDLRGKPDRSGRTMAATVQATADEVAAAAGLVMGKARGVPAAVVRGLGRGSREDTGKDLLRSPQEDLFR